MLKLKRWTQFEYPVGDEKIQFELKRLRNEEAAPLLFALTQAFAVMANTNEDTTPAQLGGLVAEFYSSLPHERVRNAFRDYVRNVKGLEDEEGPVTSGEALYDFADGSLILFVLTKLRQASALSDKEGKDSGSSSTSATEPATAVGISAVSATGGSDGIEPSTAPATVPAS